MSKGEKTTDANPVEPIGLRLQPQNSLNGLKNNPTDWHKYTDNYIYDPDQINAIQSSNEDTISEPTSIPSPFARIALAKTAFSEVAKNGDRALKAYRKIVSDCLDVAEIFFTFDKWTDLLEIIKWDKDADLRKLKDKHSRLYKALDLFLSSDAKSYNFNRMRCIYILKFKKTGGMIGATSPSTLFFSSGNTLVNDDGDFFQKDDKGEIRTYGIIQLSHNHKAFKGIKPLYTRDWEFQKYLYAWIAANDETRAEDGRSVWVFQEVRDYLDQQKRQLVDAAEIDTLLNEPQQSQKFLDDSFQRIEGFEILGKPIYKQRGIEIVSDFEIRSARSSGILPLVLPLVGGNGSGYEDWQLTQNTKWANFKAKPTADRNILPDGTRYPWLTMHDFLEEKIIRLEGEVEQKSFFEGNVKSGKKRYLLPVKDTFFRYFTTADLKDHIEINEAGDVLKVKLAVPVKKGRVVFEKEYKGNEEIISTNFNCALFPNIRFIENENAYYRFGLVCEFERRDHYQVEFVKDNSALTDKVRISARNETHSNNKQLRNYCIEGSNFDYIKIKYDHVTGVIIPKFRDEGGNKTFAFAVDFGTTNTHIEYKEGNNREKTFDISKGAADERQVHCLHKGDTYQVMVFDDDYIPEYTSEEFKFPMRTALSYGEQTNWSSVYSYPFEKASADELYEKRKSYPYNEIETNIKWSANADNNNKVKSYINSLMYLMRNKVLLNNGNLRQTKVIWFYPVSMERTRYDNLKDSWIEAYKKYFGDDPGNLVSMTESVAPYEYYVRDGNGGKLVTIDIGGGTTDIVIAKGLTVEYITSFRFAANTLFGDGYAENMRKKSGIVSQFGDSIKKELQSEINETDELFEIFNDILENKDSADAASFLFSLEYNKKVNSVSQGLAGVANLNAKLKNDTTQTITFIFFYTAIIYHLAKIMKTLNSAEMPDKIVFSGNGSRAIHFLKGDTATLKRFTKLIFEKVFGNKYPVNDLEIILNKENPKEATCKGGFLMRNNLGFQQILQKKVVLHSSDMQTLIKQPQASSLIPDPADTYAAVNQDYINKTVEETKKFVHFVFDLLPFFANEGYRLDENSIIIAKELCFKRLDVYANAGWELKKREVRNDEVIEESLFFYPLVGVLHELSSAICDKNTDN